MLLGSLPYFMDAGKRHKTPASEDLLHSKKHEHHFRVSSLCPQVPQVWYKAAHMYVAHALVCGALRLGNLLWWATSRHALCLGGRHYFIMLDSKQICPVIQRKTLSSKTDHFLNILKKILWNKRVLSVLRDPGRIFSQQIGFEFKPTSWHSLVVWFLPVSISFLTWNWG